MPQADFGDNFPKDITLDFFYKMFFFFRYTTMELLKYISGTRGMNIDKEIYLNTTFVT